MTLPANPDLEAARKLLAGAKRVLDITHINPDGDAVGSLLGFGLALRAAGKEVVFSCADPVPDAFRFLPAVDEITAKLEGEFDVVVVLDVSDPPRMGNIGASLLRPPDLQFDHHLTNPRYARARSGGRRETTPSLIRRSGKDWR